MQFLHNNIRVTYLIVFLILALGSLTLKQIPKAEDPQFEMPITLIQAFSPGLSPIDIERQIVIPIEESFGLLENVNYVEAHIKNGVVSFEVRFDHGTPPDDSFDDAVRAVNRVKPSLPKGTSFSYFKAAPTTVNVMQFGMSSNIVGLIELERQTKRLKKRLEAIDLVNKVEIWGNIEQVVKVDIDLDKLANLSLGLDQVQFAIASRGKQSQAGYFDTQQKRYSVKLMGQYDNLNQINNTIIAVLNGREIKVSDVALVYFYSHNPNYLAYLNEIPTMFVTVQQKVGANIFDVKAKVEKEYLNFKQGLDPKIQATLLFDQSESVETRVGGFMENFWFGLGLILLSLFLFIGLKEAIAVSLAIPLSLSITLFLLDGFGIAFHQMTIAGLIISLGLLVDNALVVVEACVRKVNENKPISIAASEAVKEVGWPITSGTLTTLFAFLPLLLLQSDTGDFMRALPASVSLVLIASLLSALIIIPALLVNWKIKPISRFNLQTLLEKISEKVYQPILSRSVKLPVIALLIGFMIAGFFISYFPKVGVSLFPKAEKNIVVVNIETAVNSSIEYTRNRAFTISKELEELPNVEYIVENIGGSNPRIYYNQLNRMGESHFAQLMLFLDSYDGRKVNALIEQIRDKYQNYKFAKVSVYEFQQGPVTDRPLTIRFIGDDLDVITSKAKQLTAFLEGLKGTSDVQNSSQTMTSGLKLHIDEYQVAKSGFSLPQIENSLTSLINGESVGSFYDQYGEDFRILVKPSEIDISNIISKTYLTNNRGDSVPLSSMVTSSLESEYPPFYHYQKVRMIKVSADYLSEYNVQELTAEMIAYLDGQVWDSGVYFIVGGEEAARQQSFGGLSQIMLLAIGAIFTILVIQFKSFLQPLIIFSIMPISVTGAIFGLYMTGNSFSMLAFIGMISLLGIVVNDSIILVDSFNRHILDGLDKKQAMVKAAVSRFTPIIFTSLTTILGLLPLTLYGGLLWEPMGWVIITGLMFSTLTCLFFVPSVCLLLSFRK